VVIRTKLLELLFSFSKGSLKELMEFARLPSLHLREWHLNVLDYFCELRIKRNIKEEKYQKEYIINEVFSDVPEIKKDWYDINSKLVEVANRFILYQSTDIKAPTASIDLAWYYFNNHLEKCFGGQQDSVYRYFQASKNRTFNFYFKKYDFLNLELVNNKSVKGNHNVKLAIAALDNGYIENRLWLMCEELTRKEEWHGVSKENIYPQHSEFISGAVWSVIKDVDFEDVVINYLQTMYSILLKGEIDEKVLLDLYEKRTVLFERCEKWRARTLLDYLINLFKYKLNEGNANYAAYYIELLSLYEKNNVLLEGKKLPLSIFKNAVTTALIAGKVDWSLEFLERYTRLVPDAVVNYCLAQIHLKKGQVDDAFDILPDFPPNETALYIGAKRLMLKIFYQKGHFAAIRSAIPSFKSYIKSRNNISIQYQNRTLAFIKYLSQLTENKANINASELTDELAVTDIIWVKKMTKK